MKWITWRAGLICFVSFFACSSRVFGETDEPYIFRSGIHLNQNHRFSNTQLKTLLHGFRFWTGLSEITFDGSGNLSLGDRSHVTGGSVTARNLIIAAVDGQDSFALENRDGSATIAFAQIESTERYVDGNGGRHTGWEVRLDLSDFDELTGTAALKVAFDPAINVVHELGHAICGYFDLIEGGDELGECERFINRMRLEVGLPQRLEYYPHYRMVRRADGLTFRQAELAFADTASEDKPEKLSLSFNLERVFDLSRARSKEAIHTTLIAQKNSRP